MENADNLLQVQHLEKSYGSQQTLFDVNFNCQTGRIIGLVGANGAGKTTIMRAILGLIRYDGTIFMNQAQLSFNHNQQPDQIGSLIETPGLYPYLTGREHLKLFLNPLKSNSQHITQLITDFRLEKFIDLKTKKYSLGMKQKLGIALAFLNQPQLIILDEPLNGLDAQATRDLRALITKTSATGVTFLISSHILSELQRLADDVIVIQKGHVVKQTTMSKLLDQSQHRLHLKTNDDHQAEELLRAAHYIVSFEDGLLIELTPDKTVETVVQLMAKHQLAIQDMRHLDDNLETAILKMIDEPEAQNA